MSLPGVLKALALTSAPQCEQKGSHNSEKWACVDSGGVGFFILFTLNKELSWMAQLSLPTQLNMQGFYKIVTLQS